ncbi:FadR/GntR family transcriptional regulator [Bacillus sp. 1NLA3E]|uniref:FadR/GntR family transcriptional regulator n=1 Tax=Bacillus sp. 1NLA3E TaxID=666686 RepID=UPI000247F1F0|nr:FadR/GntR family transcriptional regulator [Bacillus sp. 1NLA3E]
MKYRQIKQTKIYEEVADAVHDKIKSGELKPGDKLDSVQQLAENFCVSRSAVREALTALKAMGLIEMKQGEGTYIREFEPTLISSPLTSAILMNEDDVRNLVEVRKILEDGIVVAAAKKRSEADLEAMLQALQDMENANGNEELGEKADFQFHFALASATRNPLLVSLINNVSGLMVETMRETRRLLLYKDQSTIENLYEEHLAIYRAILSQDEEKARLAMMFHLERVEVILKEFFSVAAK